MIVTTTDEHRKLAVYQKCKMMDAAALQGVYARVIEEVWLAEYAADADICCGTGRGEKQLVQYRFWARYANFLAAVMIERGIAFEYRGRKLPKDGVPYPEFEYWYPQTPSSTSQR